MSDNLVKFQKKNKSEETNIKKDIINTLNKSLKANKYCAYVNVVFEGEKEEDGASIQAFLITPDSEEKAEELISIMREYIPKDAFVTSSVLNSVGEMLLHNLCHENGAEDEVN